jgi:outer membrane protein TolC
LARFNATLNRPGNAPIEFPKAAPVVRIELADAQLIGWVASNNPELQALSFDIAAATAAKEHASKAFYPDFSVGIDYIATDKARVPDVAGSGDDPVAAAFTMTLPIRHGSYRAGVREAQARITGARARRDQRLNSLEAETVNTLFRLRDAQRQIDLYQTTLVPKANESLAATQRAYSTGSAAFADLIDAQRTLLVFELAEVRAITDHNLARTRLEALVGQPLGTSDSDEELHHEP